MFNRFDGQDTVAASTTTDNALSIGNAVYADLLFQKNGNDLILNVGAIDRITFTGYYACTAESQRDCAASAADYLRSSGTWWKLCRAIRIEQP